ncbi:MAG: hypothetical protein ACEQSE_00955 [Candidatus Aquirickettsiella gammari]
MKYPHQRYADHTHFQHYAAGWSNKALAKHLKRSERTIKDWLSGAQKVPFWVPELLRLERYEKHHQLNSMGINQKLAKLGMVHGHVINFPTAKAQPFNPESEKQKAPVMDAFLLNQN